MNLRENVAGALAYSLGFISGMFFLLTEKENRFIRFHAIQSTLTFVILWIVSQAVSYIPFVGGQLTLIVQLATVVIWVVCIYKAYKKEYFKLPFIGDVAESWVKGEKVEVPAQVIKAIERITESIRFPDIDKQEKFLREKYVSWEFIGEGGFARVYKAKRKDGGVVAVKIPRAMDEATGKSFMKEVMNWQNLRHQNIVRLFDANVLPIPFLEMEYCDGGSLKDEKKPMDVDRAAWIVFNVAEGLKHAHSRKIIHLDLKPGNIMFSSGIPKISDWGLSVFIGGEVSVTSKEFTPLYAAPEQLEPDSYGRPDKRTDIWQLGVILYELVTGELPFKSVYDILNPKYEPTNPSELNESARDIEPIIMKALRRKKEERYRSIDEMQLDLARFLGVKYEGELRKSISIKDLNRIVRYGSDLALVHLKVGNYVDAVKCLYELKTLTKNREFDNLISQIELAMKENIKLSLDSIREIDLKLHKIKNEFS